MCVCVVYVYLRFVCLCFVRLHLQSWQNGTAMLISGRNGKANRIGNICSTSIQHATTCCPGLWSADLLALGLDNNNDNHNEHIMTNYHYSSISNHN